MKYAKKNGLKLTVTENCASFSDGSSFDITEGYLSISVSEEHQGHGLAAVLIYSLLITRPNDLWYKIDGDASGGFWDYVGMKEGRYGYMVYRRPSNSTRWRDTEGGEKSITHQELLNWAAQRI